MDIVYILKEQYDNVDLAFSLRTVEKNVTGYDRIWFAGYKPSWVSDDIQLIPNAQYGKKYINAYNNKIAACKCREVSDSFVLFNDDFFAIKPVDLRTDINLCIEPIADTLKRQKGKSVTMWRGAFWQMLDLLNELESEHYMNFELHLPTIVNKEIFLELFSRKVVQNHLKRYQIIMCRTLYGNLYWGNPTQVKDCKIAFGKDASDEMLKGQWLSVYDNVTNNLEKYPKLRSVLATFSRSKWEKEQITPAGEEILRKEISIVNDGR